MGWTDISGKQDYGELKLILNAHEGYEPTMLLLLFGMDPRVSPEILESRTPGYVWDVSRFRIGLRDLPTDTKMFFLLIQL